MPPPNDNGWKAALEQQTKELKRNSDVMNKLIERIQKMAPAPGTPGGSLSGKVAGKPDGKEETEEDRAARFAEALNKKEQERERIRSRIGAGTQMVSAMMQPMQTAQERAAGLMKSGSNLLGQAAGYNVAQKMGFSESTSTTIGQAAGQLAESAMANRLHKDETVIGRAKGGFSDMEDLAAMGFQFSDDEVKSRASRNIEMEKRRYDFQVRAGNAVGNEYGGLKGADPLAAMKDSLDAVVKVLDVFKNSIDQSSKGISAVNSAAESEFRRNR